MGQSLLRRPKNQGSVALTYLGERWTAALIANTEFFDQALWPSMDIYRICWAMQNLWLAACAEGLGVEWIRLADAGAVARLLALPPRVQLIAYRCLGIPQAFHGRPRRAVVDWQVQRRLDAHIYTDIWGQTGDSLAAVVRPPDEHAPHG